MIIDGREQEAALIGTILKDNSRFEYVSSILADNDFDWECYKWAWQAITRLRSQNMIADAITVGDELSRASLINQFQNHDQKTLTGRAAIAELRKIANPAALMSYVENIKDYSNKKEYISVFSEGAYWANNGRRGSEIKSDILSRLGAIKTFTGAATSHTQTAGQAVADASEYTSRAAENDNLDIPTGYIDLDGLLDGGMTEPDFLVIAGRPGMGKSALLDSIFYNVATAKSLDAKPQKRGLLFGLEMSNRQTIMRLISMHSGISYGLQRKGRIPDWNKYNNAVETIEKLPILFNDLSAITISQMRRAIDSALADGKLDYIGLDYIQLSGADEKHDRRDLEIGEVTRGLKAIAKEYKLPVLAAAQMSRAIEGRADKEPQLSDLRESGSIENDADIIMFLYKGDDIVNNITKLKIAKNRNGAVGIIELRFFGERTRFENATSTTITIGDAR